MRGAAGRQAPRGGQAAAAAAAAGRSHRDRGRVHGPGGEGRGAEVRQAPGGAGLQSDVHHHRAAGPHGTAARQQDLPADLAAAPGEQGRRVQGEGEVTQSCFSLPPVTHTSSCGGSMPSVRVALCVVNRCITVL